MADDQQHALSHVLDQLESAAHGERIKVEEVVDNPDGPDGPTGEFHNRDGRIDF